MYTDLAISSSVDEAFLTSCRAHYIKFILGRIKYAFQFGPNIHINTHHEATSHYHFSIRKLVTI